MLPPPSPMETDIIMSDSRKYRSLSIMSLDDPETREAAETLSGLRNMGKSTVFMIKRCCIIPQAMYSMSKPFVLCISYSSTSHEFLFLL